MRADAKAHRQPVKAAYAAAAKRTGLQYVLSTTRRLVGEMDSAYKHACAAVERDDRKAFAYEANRSVAFAAQAMAMGQDHLPPSLAARLKSQASKVDELAQLAGYSSALTTARQAPSPRAQSPQPERPSSRGAMERRESEPSVVGRVPQVHIEAAALLDVISLGAFVPDVSSPHGLSPVDNALNERSLVRSVRYAVAQSFAQSMPFEMQRTKVKLDGAEMMRAMGTVQVQKGRSSERQRAFRVSYISSPLIDADLLVGSSLGSGAYAKVRPSLLLADDGTRQQVVIKELRTAHVANSAAKGMFNRHGLARNTSVTSFDDALREVDDLQNLGGPFLKYKGVLIVDDKIFILTEHMDGGSLLAASLRMPPHLRGDFARIAMVDLTAHYQYIAAKNFVHADGKLENALVSYAQGRVVASDFGHAPRMGSDGLVTTPTPVTYLSPEIAHFGTEGRDYACTGFGTPHDVWTLGTSAMRLLVGDTVSSNMMRTPQQLLALRRIVFPQAAQEVPTMLPLRDLQALVDAGVSRVAPAAQMLARDEGLARFVLWRMFEPDPAKRATLSECEETFAALAASSSTPKSRVFAELGAQLSDGEEAFDKLHQAADMLEQGS